MADITPSCGTCRTGQCTRQEFAKSSPIIFLELYQVILVIGFICILNGMLINFTLNPLTDIIDADARDAFNTSKKAVFYFILVGVLFIIVGVLSYFYHRTLSIY